jgi:hypothetical protein
LGRAARALRQRRLAGGGRGLRAAQRVHVALRSQCAAGGTHIGRRARVLRQRRLGRVIVSSGRHSACSSRRTRDAPPAAQGGTHTGRTARALRQRRLGRAVALRGRHRSHCDCDEQPAAHTWTAHPSASSGRAGVVGRAVASRGRHSVFVPPRSRCAAGGTRMGRVAHALSRRRPGRAVASRVLDPPRSRCAVGGTHTGRSARPPPAPAGRAVALRGRHSECPARRDRDAQLAAHAWAARRALSASAGWGGWPRRAGGAARAHPAAMATRRRRHSCGPHGARHQPASPGDGGRVVRAGQRVPDPLNSRLSSDGTHTGRTARARPPPAPAGEGGRVARAARCVPASRAAHTLAARASAARYGSASAGWGGR